jgi:hypothetical protein
VSRLWIFLVNYKAVLGGIRPRPDPAGIPCGNPAPGPWGGRAPQGGEMAALHRSAMCEVGGRHAAYVSGSVDQWWKALPRRSRGQTQATRGDNDPPQRQLACPVLLPVC